MNLTVLERKISRFQVLLIFGFLIVFSFSRAQAPYVSAISKPVGKNLETISLTGINFGTTPSNINVWFGGVMAATPSTISDQYLEVKVPMGASFDFVKVVNTFTGLMGASDEAFMPSFGGQNPFDETRVSSQVNFDNSPIPGNDLYDVAVSDLDGDGKLDMVTANKSSTQVSVFLNTSPVGSLSFTRTTLTPGVNTIHVATGDLNGDAKPDVVLSELNGTNVFIYKNTSSLGSISFTSQTITLLPGSKANQLRIEDIDMDGKPELIISDQSSSRIYIARNQSTLAAISLGTPQPILLGNPSNTPADAMGIGDLNGDHFPDFVIGEFLAATSNVFVFKNASTPGSINLIAEPTIVLPTTVSNIALGDFNGDRKPDVAVTLLLSASVMIFGNQSTGGEISLASPVVFECGLRPWGIDVGDLDGDGKLDIAVASITQKTINVLSNQSTTGTFNFNRKQLATSFINRIVRLVDMDLDGRSDITFTSIDDNVLGIMASKVSIFRNVNCVTPVISPGGPLTVCNGFTQRLESSVNAAATYEWFKDGVSQGAPGSISFFDVAGVTASGSYTVRMVEGTCSRTSTPVQVNVISAAALGPATISPVIPVCIGGTLNLSVSNVGATQYLWTGPGGFSASGLNVSRSSFQTSMAGEYNLEVMAGTCVAERLSVIVDVVNVPEVSVQFSGSDIICAGDSKQLNVFPEVTGYTYQWAEQAAGDISGATGNSHTINATGKYLVKLKSIANASCPAIATQVQKIRVASLPVVNFDNPDENCTGQLVPFTDQSTVDIDPEDTEVNYTWDFGDSESSDLQNPTHTFSSANVYTVELTITYRDNSCPASSQKSLTLTAAPSLQITNPEGIYHVCENDSLKLEVLGTISSYLWGDGETTPFLYTEEGGEVTVDVTVGCKISLSKQIQFFPKPDVEATADPQEVNLGEPTRLEASGLEEYHWKPNRSVEDSLSAVTNAVPGGSTIYTVYGTDENGCYGEATVTVTIIGEDVINLLNPPNYFSPNGDQYNQAWEVLYMDGFDQCSVTIFDERGFKVFEAKPYLNDWEGISQKGQKLPSGVYFYLIRCDDSSKILTGSINLIR